MPDFLRLFFTSWSFFDQPGDELRTRLVLHKGRTPIVERDWPEPPDRTWWRLFFNPAGNDYYYSKQLEARAALLSQTFPSQPDLLLRSREFRKYLDHVSESVGPDNFDTMNLNLEIKKMDSKEFTALLSLTLPISSEAKV